MRTRTHFPLGSAERPLRVAIVGSGPSGFYAADALFKQRGVHLRVDMFERMAMPYGLVRYGVAPDHQSIKRVIRSYAMTARDPRFRFFGNVQVGRDLTVEQLRKHFDQVVYAFGCSSDRRLGIPGEDLPGSHTATAFVAWYNGHPDHRNDRFDLSGSRAAVVGVGNVAMDVTRILVKDPEALASTDIAHYALDTLRKSRIKEVLVLGRRGPVQAKFTPKEIQEIGSLPDVDVMVRKGDLELDEYSLNEMRSKKAGAPQPAVHDGAGPVGVPRRIAPRPPPVSCFAGGDPIHRWEGERSAGRAKSACGRRARLDPVRGDRSQRNRPRRSGVPIRGLPRCPPPGNPVR